MRALRVILGLGLLAAACGSLQKPIHFAAPNNLDNAVEAVSQALLAEGYANRKIGRQSNVVQTSWQDTHVPSGKLKEQPASVVRRFTVTVAPAGKGVNVTVRMDMKRCQEGAVSVKTQADAEDPSDSSSEAVDENQDDDSSKDADESPKGKEKNGKDDDKKDGKDDDKSDKAKKKGKKHQSDEDDDEKDGKDDDESDKAKKKGKKHQGDEDGDDADSEDDGDEDDDAKAKSAKKEAKPVLETTLRGTCEDLTVMPSGFQEELQALSKKLEEALRAAETKGDGDSDDSSGDSSSSSDSDDDSSADDDS